MTDQVELAVEGVVDDGLGGERPPGGACLRLPKQIARPPTGPGVAVPMPVPTQVAILRRLLVFPPSGILEAIEDSGIAARDDHLRPCGYSAADHRCDELAGGGAPTVPHGPGHGLLGHGRRSVLRPRQVRWPRLPVSLRSRHAVPGISGRAGPTRRGGCHRRDQRRPRAVLPGRPSDPGVAPAGPSASPSHPPLTFG